MPKYTKKQRSARGSGGGRPAGRSGRVQRIRIRDERRIEPDVRKIARAVVSIALAQAERDAAAQFEARRGARPEGDAYASE